MIIEYTEWAEYSLAWDLLSVQFIRMTSRLLWTSLNVIICNRCIMSAFLWWKLLSFICFGSKIRNRTNDLMVWRKIWFIGNRNNNLQNDCVAVYLKKNPILFNIGFKLSFSSISIRTCMLMRYSITPYLNPNNLLRAFAYSIL